MLCIFWKILTSYSYIFDKLHISHLVMHLHMVNAHLTSWEGLMKILDYTFDFRVFSPHIEMLRFLLIIKEKYPSWICNFLLFGSVNVGSLLRSNGVSTNIIDMCLWVIMTSLNDACSWKLVFCKKLNFFEITCKCFDVYVWHAIFHSRGREYEHFFVRVENFSVNELNFVKFLYMKLMMTC